MKIEIDHTEMLDLQSAVTKANKIIEAIIKRYYEGQKGTFESGTFVMAWDEDESEKVYAVYQGHNPESEYSHNCKIYNDNGELEQIITTYKVVQEMDTLQLNKALNFQS